MKGAGKGQVAYSHKQCTPGEQIAPFATAECGCLITCSGTNLTIQGACNLSSSGLQSPGTLADASASRGSHARRAMFWPLIAFGGEINPKLASHQQGDPPVLHAQGRLHPHPGLQLAAAAALQLCPWQLQLLCVPRCCVHRL